MILELVENSDGTWHWCMDECGAYLESKCYENRRIALENLICGADWKIKDVDFRDFEEEEDK